MASGAVLAVSLCQMVWGAGIVAEVALDTCCCGISIDAVLVTISALRSAVPTCKGVSRLAVREEGRDPRPFAVALRAADRAELIEVGINMALVAVSAYLLIFTFCLMTVYAEDVIVCALELKTGPLFMFKLPWLPVLRRMACTALLLKLPFMDVLMTVNTLIPGKFVSLFRVAFFTPCANMLACKREDCLFVMVEG